MVHIDRSPEPHAADLEPGTYLVAVTSCEVKTAKSGFPYFNVELCALDHENARLCYDILMLGGRGRDIGNAKLGALGIPADEDDIEPRRLVGRHVRVTVVNETYDGKERLTVDIKAPGSACGYYPVDQPEPDVLDDTPF
ncbi:MAG: hypothetical protein VW405_13175 [Rhodospirillaceae bacterium]